LPCNPAIGGARGEAKRSSLNRSIHPASVQSSHPVSFYLPAQPGLIGPPLPIDDVGHQSNALRASLTQLSMLATTRLCLRPSIHRLNTPSARPLYLPRTVPVLVRCAPSIWCQLGSIYSVGNMGELNISGINHHVMEAIYLSRRV
jgi:hypothetical protein